MSTRVAYLRVGREDLAVGVKRRIFDLSPGVVGRVRKTLIHRVLEQEEGPHETSIGRSVTPLVPVAELSSHVEITRSSLAGPFKTTPTTFNFLYRFSSAELERFADHTEVMEPQPAKDCAQRHSCLHFWDVTLLLCLDVLLSHGRELHL